MKSITIRKVPEPVHRQLRIRAAKNGRSLEAELRAILLRLAHKESGAKMPQLTERNDGAADEMTAGRSEIALTERDVVLGSDDAMKKVRKILREEPVSAAAAA